MFYNIGFYTKKLDIRNRNRYNLSMKLNDDEILLLKNQICFPAYAVANKILRRYQPLLKELGLTYTQYIIMMVMWEKQEVNEKFIGDALYLKSNTLTDTLCLMEKKGLIEKYKDKKDKRNLVIRITDKGKELKRKAINIPRSLEEEHWLSDDEFIVLKKLLYKLLEGEWCK